MIRRVLAAIDAPAASRLLDVHYGTPSSTGLARNAAVCRAPDTGKGLAGPGRDRSKRVAHDREHMTGRHVDTDRPKHLRRAVQLEGLTVGWNAVEGIIAVAAALAAGSVALLGFGIDSFVETVSGAVILWRIAAERRATDATRDRPSRGGRPPRGCAEPVAARRVRGCRVDPIPGRRRHGPPPRRSAWHCWSCRWP